MEVVFVSKEGWLSASENNLLTIRNIILALLNLVYWDKNHRPYLIFTQILGIYIQNNEFELIFNFRSFSCRTKNRQNSIHKSSIPQKWMDLIAPF